jgi:hypothetical protein
MGIAGGGVPRGNTVGQAPQNTLVRGQRHAAIPGANLNTIGMGSRGRRNIVLPLAFDSPPVYQRVRLWDVVIDVLPIGSTVETICKRRNETSEAREYLRGCAFCGWCGSS